MDNEPKPDQNQTKDQEMNESNSEIQPKGISEVLMRHDLYNCSGFKNPLPESEMKDLFKRYRESRGKHMEGFGISERDLTLSWNSFITRWNSEPNFISILESQEKVRSTRGMGKLRHLVHTGCEKEGVGCFVDLMEVCKARHDGVRTNLDSWNDFVRKNPLSPELDAHIRNYERALHEFRRSGRTQNKRAYQPNQERRDSNRERDFGPAWNPPLKDGFSHRGPQCQEHQRSNWNEAPRYPDWERNQANVRDNNDWNRNSFSSWSPHRDGRRFSQRSIERPPYYRSKEGDRHAGTCFSKGSFRDHSRSRSPLRSHRYSRRYSRSRSRSRNRDQNYSYSTNRSRSRTGSPNRNCSYSTNRSRSLEKETSCSTLIDSNVDSSSPKKSVSPKLDCSSPRKDSSSTRDDSDPLTPDRAARVDQVGPTSVGVERAAGRVISRPPPAMTDMEVDDLRNLAQEAVEEATESNVRATALEKQLQSLKQSHEALMQRVREMNGEVPRKIVKHNPPNSNPKTQRKQALERMIQENRAKSEES